MTGMNRSSILRTIKRGTLTGTKDHNEVWHVDGAELARVFPVNTQLAPQDIHPTPWPLTSWRSPRAVAIPPRLALDAGNGVKGGRRPCQPY
jgi:hypothetical protein